jgi:hypothetical protein
MNLARTHYLIYVTETMQTNDIPLDYRKWLDRQFVMLTGNIPADSYVKYVKRALDNGNWPASYCSWAESEYEAEVPRQFLRFPHPV